MRKGVEELRIGLDVGSTTIKCVVLDERDQLIYQSYQRHYSQVLPKAAELFAQLRREVIGEAPVQVAVSGSAGMGIAEGLGLPFVQEVYATRVAVKRWMPDTDVVIELGGEDAKILFMTGSTEVRMNGSCAGGTGAFIDQMATLLQLSPEEMNRLAAHHTHRYEIASRCGVFAKSDIQPLLNQGAKKEDVAASIFYAVVNQTVAGLAQGRPIAGKVLYLGGPLTFLSQLRAAFDDTLHLTGICPDNSLYYVALGAASYGDSNQHTLGELCTALSQLHTLGSFESNPPLFASEEEYASFAARHGEATLPQGSLENYQGSLYLGIDSGSTTVKAVALGEEGQLLYQSYQSNASNPIPLVRDFLTMLRRDYPHLPIVAAAVTGYGEEMMQNAFGVDYGIVETVAHFTAAKAFQPQLDFVIDIGGQDMKCFQVKNGAIDNIFLNEACSSGCGSFLQTFANALGYSIQDFARLGLFAKHPVNLGSRCTVFMNSSVKQAQKDGATMEDISAGLSISVVKNALYKVIRAASAEDLGRHVVVQGGTFLNDSVLRSFEQELGIEVVRPTIAGLMGAYGAALYAQKQAHQEGKAQSSLLSLQELDEFTHSVRNTTCQGCSNHCKLSINSFGGGRRFVGGNRCQKPVTNQSDDTRLNLYHYKRELLASFGAAAPQPGKPTIGLPMVLSFYDLLPFWHKFFTTLGFGVKVSPFSTREMYLAGQQSIPSDTVCFPAKLTHGHIEALLQMGVDAIFYPCMSYNLEEHRGDNHYNCPVVAYYPEVLAANLEMGDTPFLYDYLGLHRPRDFSKKIQNILAGRWPGLTLSQVEEAVAAGFAAYDAYREEVRTQGERITALCRAESRQMIVLAGRPYHIDPEVNHGIDQLITGYGYGVLTEDAVCDKTGRVNTRVLNQWTYHSRLYAAAQYVTTQPDLQLVQLVSFGCGVDAITGDETRRILEEHNKLYTQIKIDEITNLGTVKIRLRSLFAAISQQKKEVPAP